MHLGSGKPYHCPAVSVAPTLSKIFEIRDGLFETMNNTNNNNARSGSGRKRRRNGSGSAPAPGAQPAQKKRKTSRQNRKRAARRGRGGAAAGAGEQAFVAAAYATLSARDKRKSFGTVWTPVASFTESWSRVLLGVPRSPWLKRWP